MKIVFWGTSEFSLPALNKLSQEHEVVAVITMPDQPAGRNKILNPPPIKLTADKIAIPVLQPSSLKDNAFFEKFKDLNPDLGIVAAYGKIIPEKYLSVPEHGTVNIHPSLLPKYRGPTPVQTAILNGDKETGVTIMVVDKEMDHGPILMQEQYDILPDVTYTKLHNELAGLGSNLLLKIIRDLDSIKPHQQDHNQATFTKMFTRQDGRINWSETGDKIYNRIRALNPEPGTWSTWKGKVLNVSKAEILNKESSSPGLVTKIDGNVAVSIKKCYLILKSVQLEGGKEMDAKSFVNGHPDFLDSVLE